MLDPRLNLSLIVNWERGGRLHLHFDGEELGHFTVGAVKSIILAALFEAVHKAGDVPQRAALSGLDLEWLVKHWVGGTARIYRQVQELRDSLDAVLIPNAIPSNRRSPRIGAQLLETWDPYGYHIALPPENLSITWLADEFLSILAPLRRTQSAE